MALADIGSVEPEEKGKARPLLVSVEEAGKLLGVGRTTVYGLIARGLLCPVHIGRLCRVPIAELDEFVARLRAEERPLG